MIFTFNAINAPDKPYGFDVVQVGVCMDIPAYIRMLTYGRPDAQFNPDDMDQEILAECKKRNVFYYQEHVKNGLRYLTYHCDPLLFIKELAAHEAKI